jgi:hypothetical protein
MPVLNGPQMGQLQQIILPYFTIQDLHSLLLYRLDRPIDRIVAPTDNYSEALMKVIAEANRVGWLEDFLHAVGEERPRLQEPIRDLLASFESQAPKPRAPTSAPVSRFTTPVASQRPAKPTVFISYSHADEGWKDRLVKQLGAVEDVLQPWDDRKIGAGQDWRPEIEKAMNRAAVAVLLISADFLTSDFITDEEVPRLLERREEGSLRVIPVIVEPCLWKRVPWLKGIQALPTDGRALSSLSEKEAKTELTAIADEIVAIIEAAGEAG